MAGTDQGPQVAGPRYAAYVTSCDCKSCESLIGLETDRPLSVAEARQKASDDNAKTAQQTAALERMLRDHGNAIAVCWNSRKTDQKKSILRTIFPEIQDTRKEQEVFADVPFKWLEDRCGAYRPAFLLRCLNVDRLAIKPEPLLAMLWFRATLPASSWAAVDHGDLDYLALWSCLVHTFHAEGSFFVMQSRYGQWTKYDKDLWHSKTAIPAPLAIQLFSAQATKAEMFSRIAHSLWNRAQNSPKCQHLTGHDVLETSAQIKPSTGREMLSWETLSFSSGSPTSPPSFHISTLEELVETWYDVARDDMLCRMHYTDYFYEDTKFWRDHDIGKQLVRTEEWK